MAIRVIRAKLFLHIISIYMNLNFNKKIILFLNSELTTFLVYIFFHILFENN
jgi:hypothetical protein